MIDGDIFTAMSAGQLWVQGDRIGYEPRSFFFQGQRTRSAHRFEASKAEVSDIQIVRRLSVVGLRPYVSRLRIATSTDEVILQPVNRSLEEAYEVISRWLRAASGP